MPGLREALDWFNHLVVVDCAPGCRYCAQTQLKAERKAQKLNALERLCLESMLELGDQAEAVAIVTRVQRRLGKWKLAKIYRCFNRLQRREMVCSRIAPQKINPVWGAKRLFRIAPAGLRALGNVAGPDEPFDDQNAQTLAEIFRSRDSLSLKEILFIGIGICFEADCAHRRGMIHGDILPQNILVSPDFKVKLIHSRSEPDQYPETDIEQIRDVLRQMTYYAPKPEEVKWITQVAAADADDPLPSADSIQYRLQYPLDSTYSPPPAFEELENAVGVVGFILFQIVYWYMVHPESLPSNLRKFLGDWFGL